jgi:hypothetical protein
MTKSATITVATAASMFLLAVCLQAADVSGQWTGTIAIKDESSGTDITTTVKLQFTQQGSQISGKIGRAEDVEVVPIKDAKIDGNRITFEASNGETSEPCKFTLIIDGDRMEGEMTTALDAEKLVGKVKVTRGKS